MTDKTALDRLRFRRARLLLWTLVALAMIAGAALLLVEHNERPSPVSPSGDATTRFGGPFTLVGADGRPFSSAVLAGKPYAVYFGFTRCGDVCPTTLSRLVKLRREAGSDHSIRIVFVTIDPANDGPREVGQYAGLFNAPIIGLTGSRSQIESVKKEYGIYAEPAPNGPMGEQMTHTATVLLFDRSANFAGTISSEEPDSSALAKLKKLVA